MSREGRVKRVVAFHKAGSELSPRTFTEYESGIVVDRDAGGKEQRFGSPMAASDYMAALRDMGWREARGIPAKSEHDTDPRHPALRTRPGESVWDVQERLRRADVERRGEASAVPSRRPRERMSLSDVSSPYGAPMGRRKTMPEPGATPCVYLERVRINRGGYDSGGAYWGTGKPLYRAYDREGDVDVFLRADDHAAAEAEVRRLIPGVLFARRKGCKR